MDVAKKWTMPVPNWALVLEQIHLFPGFGFFEGRSLHKKLGMTGCRRFSGLD
jgi:hypothetical protein